MGKKPDFKSAAHWHAQQKKAKARFQAKIVEKPKSKGKDNGKAK